MNLTTAGRLLYLALTWACIGKSSPPCFAFIRGGDVAVHCGGVESQITEDANAADFAVNVEENTLAYDQWRTLSVKNGIGNGACIATLVDLRSGAIRRLDSVCGVRSTGGGIVPSGPDVGGVPRGRDLMTGGELHRGQDRVWFGSSDRRIIIGVPTGGKSALWEEVPERRLVAAAGTFDIRTLGLSPDGSWVSYINGGGRLCLSSLGGQSKCIGRVDSVDPTSVNNEGEVLVSAATSQECFYRTATDFSAHPFPGQEHGNMDACVEIAIWRPGSRSLEMVVPVGRRPQWISGATADLLRQWSSSVSTQQGPGHH